MAGVSQVWQDTVGNYLESEENMVEQLEEALDTYLTNKDSSNDNPNGVIRSFDENQGNPISFWSFEGSNITRIVARIGNTFCIVSIIPDERGNEDILAFNYILNLGESTYLNNDSLVFLYRSSKNCKDLSRILCEDTSLEEKVTRINRNYKNFNIRREILKDLLEMSIKQYRIKRFDEDFLTEFI